MTNEPINVDKIGGGRYNKPTVLVIDHETRDVLLLSHDKSKWLSTSIRIPRSNISGGTVSLDNEIYIFGGDQQERKTLQLNKVSMKWEEKATMNSRRKNISNSSVAYAGCIWACGGLGTDSEPNPNPKERERNKVLDSVEKYDPKTREWIKCPSMTKKRQNAAAAVCNGKLFICGGSDGVNYLSSVECIEASEHSWLPFKELLSPLGGHAMVFDGMQLIVMGGCLTEKHVVWGIKPNDESAEWKELKPMNATAHSSAIMTAISLEDVIIAIEGDNVEIFFGKDWRNGPSLSNGSWKTAVVITPYLAEILDERKSKKPEKLRTILAFGGEESKDMYILNENAAEWIKLELQSPESVFLGGAVICQDSIYIFGGFDLDRETYRFSVNGSNWIPCGEMKTTRYFISNSSVVFQGDIWVLGGYNSQALNTVEKYDCENDTWEIVSPMNKERVNAAAAVLSGKIFVCGGSMGGYNLDSTEWYDPRTDKWQMFDNLPSPRSGHVLLQADQCFFLMGGPGDDVLQSNRNCSFWYSHGRMLTERESFTAALLKGKPYAIGGIRSEKVELYDRDHPGFGPHLPKECASTPSLSITSHVLIEHLISPKKE